jgi:hypothetical protein
VIEQKAQHAFRRLTTVQHAPAAAALLVGEQDRDMGVCIDEAGHHIAAGQVEDHRVRRDLQTAAPADRPHALTYDNDIVIGDGFTARVIDYRDTAEHKYAVLLHGRVADSVTARLEDAEQAERYGEPDLIQRMRGIYGGHSH